CTSRTCTRARRSAITRTFRRRRAASSSVSACWATRSRSTRSCVLQRRSSAIPTNAEQEGIMASTTDHEPHGMHQTRKATASGWIGSALEYYDFFIYAQAAALIFPQIFFPNTDPKMAIIASLATYGVGYLARPVG